MIHILGDDGKELAAGILNQAHDPVVLCVDRVTSGKGRLLQYYFGQGRRLVVADLGDFRLRGSLRTRWQNGERRWEIRLITAVPPVSGSSELPRQTPATTPSAM